MAATIRLSQQHSCSLHHLVGEGEELWRHFEPEGPCGLEVDQEFKFGGLHDREVRRPLALENATCVDATLSKCLTGVGTIRHQAAGQRELALNSHGREMIASSECDDLIQSAEQKRIGGNGERADFLLDESRKGGLQLAIGGGSEHKDWLVESARCGLHVIRLA